jgi:hypothetical protein
MVAMMIILLLTVVGGALVLITSTESAIAGNFRNANESLYAADAALELAVASLRTLGDWSLALSGSVRSGFVDGPPSGTRTLVDGTTVDLGQLINLANCEKTTSCSSAEMDLVTAGRPWGPNNPRWQLFTYGRLSDVLPARVLNSPFYIVVLVGDDPAENDGDPSRDGATPENPGSGVVMLRAEAFGSRGAHHAIEATVARPPALSGMGIRLLSWRALL